MPYIPMNMMDAGTKQGIVLVASIVIPIGITNEEIFGEMPSLFVHKVIIDGMTAIELEVAKAVGNSEGTFLKNCLEEIFLTRQIKIGYRASMTAIMIN